MAKDKFGLRELPKDKRDFQLGAFVQLPDLEELPEEFELTTPFPIKQQGNTDYCAAFSGVGVTELQENVEMYPEWQFAASKEISGSPEAWGQDLRSMAKSLVKYGSVPIKYTKDSPKIENPRVLDSYPTDYLLMAKKHRKQSFFAVSGDGKTDSYDTIRRTIWKYREEKRGILIGVIWSWRMSDYFLAPQPSGQFGHAMYITGWKKHDGKEGLVAVNSYGEEAGKNGKHLLSREVVNASQRFGYFMFLDEDPERVKEVLGRREWILASFLEKIHIFFRNWWREIWL